MKLNKSSISLIGIAAIVTLEVSALCLGFNGTILTMSIAAIAGIAGYNIKR